MIYEIQYWLRGIVLIEIALQLLVGDHCNDARESN
jgi:hypothetical protein